MQSNKSFLFGKGQVDSHIFFAAFLPFLILAISLATEFSIKAQEKKDEKQASTISGCVKVDGKPAAGIQVALVVDRSIDEKPIATATTNDNGCYRLNNISPNHYWLKVLAPEYINADPNKYEQRMRSVSVRKEAVDDANFDLITGGIISGKVTDADGNPIAGEFLALTGVWEYNSQSGYYLPSQQLECKTNADGTYKITGVRNGRYLVSIGEDIARLSGSVHYKNDILGAQGRVGREHYYEQTFHPGVMDKADAGIIEVTPGIEVQDINIIVGKALRSFTASGRAIDAETGQPISNQHIQVIHKFANGGYGGTIADDRTDENGYFHISGLLPGRFSASVYFCDDNPLITLPLDFEITNADLKGLELKARKGYSISGTVQIENSDKNAIAKLSELKLRAHCHINEDSSKYIFRDAIVKNGGGFILNGLYIGETKISLSASNFLLLNAEYVNAEGKTETLPIERSSEMAILLKNADLKNLRLTVMYKSASIKGQVKIVGGKFDSETRLSASISQKTGHEHWMTSRDVDVNGNFVIDGLEADSEYEIFIYPSTEKKIVKTTNNTESKVSFVIDLSKTKKTSPTKNQ